MSGFSHCKRKIVHIGFLILLSCLAVRCDSDSDLKFSESGGTYNHDIFVDLSLDTDSALSCAGSSESSTIYYTTDGSEPNPNTSNSYYGPIKVSGDGTVMTISAATFNSDNTIDQYAYETYTISYSDTGNNNGGTGYGGEGDNSIDGIGSSAKFDTPGMVTCDGSGNLYVADYKNRCIRIVNTTTGSVKTVAGSTSNYVEKDGIGVNAGFEFPMGICYNASTLYVSEASVYHTIRKISIPDYRVLTIAGHDSGFSDGSPLSARFFTPFDLVYAGDQLYITDYSNNRIRVYTPFSVSTFTTAVSSPIGITTDNTNLYVTDSHEIHKIVISSGAISVIAGSPSSGITDGTGISAYFNTPSGIAYANGHLYVADTGNHAIRDIDISSRNVSLFTGSVSEAGTANGVGTAARFYSPYGICTDGSYLYVTDYTNNNIRKINIATKEVTRLAGAN